MIRVEGYHKTYGDVVAVQGLSFEAPPGSVVGLVGPNGAGKTTTLRALAGIIVPTQGRLMISGADIQRDPVGAKQRLAYVPDDPKLFDALTVWEHLEFVASVYDVPHFRESAEILLTEFQLTEKRDTLTRELSRGMRQKVAICCGYLHEPSVILFDEPLTGLDPHAIRVLNDSIQKRATAGATVIVSSHLLLLVEDLCNLLVILDHGRCLFSGPLDKAKSHFAEHGEQASLEDVFFRATEQ